MVNKVILVGNVGKDPVLRNTTSGQTVTNFSLACTEKWKDKSGSKQEKTEWFNVTVWGKQAENVAKYVSKGKKVYVEGKLVNREYEADGVKNRTVDINASNVVFLSAGGGNGSAVSDEPVASQPETDDDIPF